MQIGLCFSVGDDREDHHHPGYIRGGPRELITCVMVRHHLLPRYTWYITLADITHYTSKYCTSCYILHITLEQILYITNREPNTFTLKMYSIWFGNYAVLSILCKQSRTPQYSISSMQRKAMLLSRCALFAIFCTYTGVQLCVQRSVSWCAAMVLSFCPIISQYPPSYHRDSYTFTQNHLFVIFIAICGRWCGHELGACRFGNAPLMQMYNIDYGLWFCAVNRFGVQNVRTVDESLTFW